jgi:hypothetical protein
MEDEVLLNKINLIAEETDGCIEKIKDFSEGKIKYTNFTFEVLRFEQLLEKNLCKLDIIQGSTSLMKIRKERVLKIMQALKLVDELKKQIPREEEIKKLKEEKEQLHKLLNETMLENENLAYFKQYNQFGEPPEVDFKLCSICFFNERDVAINCGHLFCPSCLDQLPESNCPICRVEIKQKLKIFL